MNAPNAVPISSTSGMATMGFQPRCSTSAASTMVVSATTDPTERSMPAVMPAELHTDPS